MKQLYILILIFGFGHMNYAQNDNTSIPLSIAYLNYDTDGHGLMISTERKINDKYVIEAALSAYKHENKDQSIAFNAIFSRRLSYPSGFSPQFGIGVGLVNTWIDNIVDEEGGGTLSMATSLKVTPLGWDFRTKKDLPIRIFFDCILQAQFPEFKAVDEYVLFQIGGTYYFGHNGRVDEIEY